MTGWLVDSLMTSNAVDGGQWHVGNVGSAMTEAYPRMFLEDEIVTGVKGGIAKRSAKL
jgi:hypothetical protein